MKATARHHTRFLRPVILIAALMVVGLSASGTVVAEGPTSAKSEKVTERVRVLRAMKIGEHFDLDDQTKDKLLDVLDKYDELLFERHKSLNKQRRALRRSLRSDDISDEEIERNRKEIIASRKELDGLRYERLEKASALLGARDRVKLMVFLPKFERKVRKVLKETRGKKGRKHRRKRRGPR